MKSHKQDTMDEIEYRTLWDQLKDAKRRIRTDRLKVGFGEKLGQHMDENGYTCKTLATKASLSERTIRRMKCEDDYRPTKEMIIAVCVAMELGFNESMRLLRLSPFRLQENSPIDAMYLLILKYEGKYSVREWNKVLLDMGEKPLGSLRKPDDNN